MKGVEIRGFIRNSLKNLNLINKNILEVLNKFPYNEGCNRVKIRDL